MNGLVPIALNTFREARRNRIFYSILFFGVGFIFLSIIFTDVTFASYDRILRDTGFGIMNLFGVGLAIFLGVGIVNREIERRTIYTVVTKPVSRWTFIAGKALGLGITLGACLALMFAGFIAVLWEYGSPLSWVLVEAALALMLELLVVTSFAVLCSTWTSSLLSGFFTLSFWVIGHMARDIRYFGMRAKAHWVHTVSRVAYAALPDLERFNLKPAVTHLHPVPVTHLLVLAAYAALWCAVFLVAGVLLFRNRDFR